MPPSSEWVFVDLIFRASRKYANWDPVIPIRVGDYGRITQGRPSWAFWRTGLGIFVKEGNIYAEGIAQEYDIPEPEECGGDEIEGTTWMTSNNVRQVEFEVVVAGCCHADKHLLLRIVPKRPTSLILPGSDPCHGQRYDIHPQLRRLLMENRINKGSVIVSEVHRTASYARYLSTKESNSIAIGLATEPVAANVGTVSVHSNWIHSASSGKDE